MVFFHHEHYVFGLWRARRTYGGTTQDQKSDPKQIIFHSCIPLSARAAEIGSSVKHAEC
jgi:hypothetical protein